MSEEAEVKRRTGRRRKAKAEEMSEEQERIVEAAIVLPVAPTASDIENQVQPDPKLAKKIADFYWKDLEVGEFISVKQLAEMFKADVHVTGVTVTSYMPDHRMVTRLGVKSLVGAGASLYDSSGLIRVRLRRREFESNKNYR